MLRCLDQKTPLRFDHARAKNRRRRKKGGSYEANTRSRGDFAVERCHVVERASIVINNAMSDVVFTNGGSQVAAGELGPTKQCRPVCADSLDFRVRIATD